MKVGVLIHPTRFAATGNPHGPSLYHLLEVLEKKETLTRIERVLDRFEITPVPLKTQVNIDDLRCRLMREWVGVEPVLVRSAFSRRA